MKIEQILLRNCLKNIQIIVKPALFDCVSTNMSISSRSKIAGLTVKFIFFETALTLILFLCSSGLILAQQTADENLNRAKEFFAAENYMSAIESLNKCVDAADVKIKTDCVILRGKAFRRSGDKAKAAADFRRVLESNPNDAKANEYLKNLDLTAEQLSDKAQILSNAGKPAEVLDLILDYPEYADETGVLYFKSVSYVELKNYQTADVYFQKQFDTFFKNGLESLKSAEEASKSGSNDIASLMYSTALISFGSADLVNSLRAVATEKNGLPDKQRNPKNLPGYDEFVKTYEKTALTAADFDSRNNQTDDALQNYGKVIELNPKNRAAYLGRAKVYRKLRKVRLALADEQKAKSIR